MQQARPRGLKATFVCGDGFFAPKLMELGGKAVEGTIVSFLAPPWQETPGAEALLKRYRDRYGEEVKPYAPFAYDAAMKAPGRPESPAGQPSSRLCTRTLSVGRELVVPPK